ncbi:hypothetical protein GW934_02400 [Candidatus Falkowbacteria bacterium]|nr:hypothetical protein [Candidatus Falkowbacteria bacterium]
MGIFLFKSFLAINSPILDLFFNLKNSKRNKIIAILEHLEEAEKNFCPPFVKNIDHFCDGSVLYEIRISFSKELLRIFCSHNSGDIILYEYLIKPHFYDKRKEKIINKEYFNKINKSKNDYSSFLSKAGELIEIEI